MQTHPNDTQELSARILALLDMPLGGEGSPSLRDLEDTLTTGYALALALEGERSRIERSLASGDAMDVAELHDRLAEVELSVTDLRRLLFPLRSRARAARSLSGSSTY